MASNHGTVGSDLGLKFSDPAKKNWERVRPLFEDMPGSVELRGTLQRTIASQTLEFHHINLDFGFRYDCPGAAVVREEGPEYVPIDAYRVYEPDTKPGCTVPHAWISRGDGTRIPLCSLVGSGNFLLIASNKGSKWLDAGKALAGKRGISLTTVMLGADRADEHQDIQMTWLAKRRIGVEGCVLVRPDRFVCWRSMGASKGDSLKELGDVFRTVLGSEGRGEENL